MQVLSLYSKTCTDERETVAQAENPLVSAKLRRTGDGDISSDSIERILKYSFEMPMGVVAAVVVVEVQRRVQVAQMIGRWHSIRQLRFETLIQAHEKGHE